MSTDENADRPDATSDTQDPGVPEPGFETPAHQDVDPGLEPDSARDSEASAEPGAPGPSGSDGDVAAKPVTTSAWRTLAALGRPRMSASNVLVGLLCALLGFALVVQMRQTRDESLSSLRQTELVRLLDEVTQRSSELEQRADDLRASRNDLLVDSEDNEAALELARQRAATQGILSGRLPAEGTGITVRIREGSETLSASALFTILEELRNAGAEAVDLNGVRIVASSYFVDSAQGVVLDGTTLESPYVWLAIGNPETLTPALEIPGGAMSSVRTAGGTGTISSHNELTIDSVRTPSSSQFATPVEPEEGA